MTERVADLTLAEAAQRLRRYRPLVLTVVLTLGILRALPEHDSAVEEAQQPTAAAAAATSPSAREPVADATPDPPPSPDARPGTPLLRASAPAPVPPTPTTAMAETPSVPSPSPSPSTSPSTDRPGAPAPTILHTGWATRAAGTPAGTVGVPEDTLPVGNRLGQIDKASFLRLDGDWQALVLPVDADGSTGVGEPSVQACAITTEAWEPLTGSSFDEAPEWNPDDCTAGVVGAGGEWTFQVGSIDLRFGVALVPAPDAPVEFRIAFRTPA